jgi:hypothetical protein
MNKWNVCVTNAKNFKQVLNYISTVSSETVGEHHLSYFETNNPTRMYISFDESTGSWNYNKTVDSFDCFSKECRITWSEFLKMSNPTLKTKGLECEDIIELFGKRYRVTGCGPYWLLIQSRALENDQVFEDAGINNKHAFQKEILGYTNVDKDSVFPECKSLEDLTKLVEAIKNYKTNNNNMNKKLVGYKLTKKGKIALKRGHISWADNLFSAGGHDDLFFTMLASGAIDEAKSMGVLDIWFEPAYEKEETIRIGGYEVDFEKNKTTISGYEFTKEFWEAALVIAQNDKAAVWVGCGAKAEDSAHKWTVDEATIIKILNKLK